MIKFVEFLPMLASYLFTYLIFMEIDKKYYIVSKIDLKIRCNGDWKPVIYVSFMLIVSLIICMIGISSDRITFILNGIIIGIALNFINFTEKR